MYSEIVIRDTVSRLERAHGIDLIPYSPAECEDWTARLNLGLDPETKQLKPDWVLTSDEQAFIENEIRMCKASWRHFAERYVVINKTANRLGSMYPLLESQDFVLGKISELELQTFRGERQDGILVNFLKGARQIGGSTLAEAILAHRICTQGNLFGLIASDDPGGSAYLFSMMESMIERLPWWLQPKLTDQVKNTELKTDADSHIWIGSGKSMRGTTGQRGQLGRGKSLSLIHLSEVSTWESSWQIDASLMPTIPVDPRVFVMFESTAKGRDNWWHKHWRRTNSGIGRFVNIFIPWYVEGRYSKEPPPAWEPSPETLAHARHCEETSSAWLGHPVQLSRPQLYWYEDTRRYYEAMDDFKAFIEEYGSVNDEDCFQAAGFSIFSAALQQKVKDRARPLAGVLEVMPMKEVR